MSQHSRSLIRSLFCIPNSNPYLAITLTKWTIQCPYRRRIPRFLLGKGFSSSNSRVYDSSSLVCSSSDPFPSGNGVYIVALDTIASEVATAEEFRTGGQTGMAAKEFRVTDD